MTEQERFEAWIAGQSGRVTGWMVWCASLAARNYPTEGSRPAFDTWLAHARLEAGRKCVEWELVDAWIAGATYVQRVMGD
jgi:hypothetical protein